MKKKLQTNSLKIKIIKKNFKKKMLKVQLDKNNFKKNMKNQTKNILKLN